MPTYVLGARTFRSKTAARDEFRRILADAEPDRPLVGDDAALVGLLVTAGRHPEAVEKIGPGIAEIVVRPAAYGTRCLWIRRLDGSEVDFSYLTALNGPANPKTAVVAALRAEIDDQIRAARVTEGSCGLCGRALAEPVHVDHAEPTLDVLASRFAEVIGGWSAVEIECVGAYGRRLADRAQAEVWRIYHQQTAVLRSTHAACNLSRKRGS